MNPASLDLGPRLDLTAVAALQAQILGHRGADLALDASRVEHLGALALQILRAAARSWAEDGHELTFENASKDVMDQLVLFGFTAETVTRWEPPQ